MNEMVLNPIEHGVAYAELLAYKLHSLQPANEVKNLNEFNQQFRHLVGGIPIGDLAVCGKAMTHASRQFTKAVLAINAGMVAIGPLKMLVNKITGQTTTEEEEDEEDASIRPATAASRAASFVQFRSPFCHVAVTLRSPQPPVRVSSPACTST